MNLSKTVSMDLIDRIERAIQFTECTNTVDLLRECEEEISKMRAALELGRKMRMTQAAYFKDRSRDVLIASKMAETEFDKAIRAALGGENG